MALLILGLPILHLSATGPLRVTEGLKPRLHHREQPPPPRTWHVPRCKTYGDLLSRTVCLPARRQLFGRENTANLEVLLMSKPDLVLDVGSLD